MANLIPWLIITTLLIAVTCGDPVGRDRIDEEPSGDESGSGGEASEGGPGEASSLAVATARLMEELAKHGMSSSSPFALLLNSEASLWGNPRGASGEAPALSVPLAQAGSAARAAAAAAWDSPLARAARHAFAPCATPDADLFLCARESVLKVLERAGRMGDVRLLGGAVTVRRAEDAGGRALPQGVGDAPEDELQQLPEDPAAREERLDQMIAAKLTDLAASHVITLRATPEVLEVAKSGVEEYRGKKGGKYLPFLFMMALMMKGMLMALAMGTIAMIAGKALTVGLMALVLSGVIGLKKLASQGGGGYEVVNVSPSHHHARHLQSPAAQGLDAVFELPESVAPLLEPYRAHRPLADAASDRR